MSSGTDAKRLVADGYDQIAHGLAGLRRAGTPSGRKRAYLEQLTRGIEDGAWVLDLGCGPGEQAAWLSERFRVAGVDISRVQLALARAEAPDTALLLGDMCSLPIRPGSVAAVAAIYSIFHVPREAHEPLFATLYDALRPAGRLFAVLGANSWEGTEENWLDLGATMFWSQHSAAIGVALLEQAGFEVEDTRVEADELVGSGAHLFVLAEKPA